MEQLRLEEYETPLHLEYAGALQVVLRTVDDRSFDLDIQQRESLEGIGSAIALGQTTGYVEMATSTGKTTVESLLAEAAVRAGKRVLLLAPSIAIADQISGKTNGQPTGLAKFTDLHNQHNIGHHYGTSRAKKSSAVVISTYQGFLGDYKRDHQTLGHFDVVIADECHKSLGKETSTAMTSAFPGAIKIGLSATPDYAANRMSEEVYNKRLYEFSLKEAIEADKTAPVRALIYESEATIKLNERRKYFTDEELAVLIPNMERNGVAAKLAQELVASGRQGIIACVPGNQNIHARMVAQLLNTRQFGRVRAADIGSHLKSEEIKERLEAFKEGGIDVLTFTKSLEEGWDSDRASFCLNLSPTESPVRTKQLLGRILRKKPSGIEGIYIDFVDKKVGAKKQQYTAMHALGLETIDLERVIGQYSGQNYQSQKVPLPLFSMQLMEKLLSSQGKSLREVTIGNVKELTPEELLQQKWEKILADEGMPAELGGNIVVPERFTSIYDKAVASYIRDNGVLPTHQEILDLIEPKVLKSAMAALRYFGLQIAFDDVTSLDFEDTYEPGRNLPAEYLANLVIDKQLFAELPVDENDQPYEQVAQNLLQEQIYAVFDTLSGRENGILSMRFGIGNLHYRQDNIPLTAQEVEAINRTSQAKLRDIDSDSIEEVGYITGDDMTFRDIGKIYGVSGGRIGQIDSKTFSKLRHPSRARVLEDYYFDRIPSPYSFDFDIDNPRSIREGVVAFSHHSMLAFLNRLEDVPVKDFKEIAEIDVSEIKEYFSLEHWNRHRNPYLRPGSFVNLCNVVLPYIRAVERRATINGNPDELPLLKLRLGVRLLERLSKEPSRKQVTSVPV